MFEMVLQMSRGAGTRSRRSLAGFTLLLLLSPSFVLTGCARQGSDSGGVAPLRVERFNYEDFDRVPLNGALIFTFNDDVDPLTVNSDTIRISTTIDGTRREAAGTFFANGCTVTWFPRMTSRAFPVGRGPRSPLLPDDAGLNTDQDGLTYHVVVPSLPNPNTVRGTIHHRPVGEAFVATFKTRPAPGGSPSSRPTDLASLFDPDAPFFRQTLRVADVLAYGGGERRIGFAAWIRNPASTSGENPLFLNPALLAEARTEWRGRDVSGEWVDEVLGLQLIPRMTVDELKRNAFPPGVALRDERLVSNLHGARRGRSKEVTGLRLYFAQPILPNPFVHAARGGASPVEVRVLAEPTDDPSAVAPLPCDLEFANLANLHAGLVTLTFRKPIRKGWIRVSVDPTAVSGFPGGRLEGNSGGEFVTLWPVEIRAE